jgi:hypothetical protein
MGFGSEPPTLKRQRQPSREIDRERIGFASSKDEERSLRLMLLIVVMNQRVNQATSSWPGWPVASRDWAHSPVAERSPFYEFAT